jgi:hypothetical protein
MTIWTGVIGTPGLWPQRWRHLRHGRLFSLVIIDFLWRFGSLPPNLISFCLAPGSFLGERAMPQGY